MSLIVCILCVVVMIYLDKKKKNARSNQTQMFFQSLGKGHDYVEEYIRACDEYMLLYKQWISSPFFGDELKDESNVFHSSAEFDRLCCHGMCPQEYALRKAKISMVNDGYLPVGCNADGLFGSVVNNAELRVRYDGSGDDPYLRADIIKTVADPKIISRLAQHMRSTVNVQILPETKEKYQQYCIDSNNLWTTY